VTLRIDPSAAKAAFSDRLKVAAEAAAPYPVHFARVLIGKKF
jgi:hypothetical protein